MYRFIWEVLEVSYNAKEFLLQNNEVEGIMRGEGEKIFANFVTAVSDGE